MPITESQRQINRRYYLKHRDGILEQTKEYYLKNKEHIDRRIKEWRKNNLDKVRGWERKRDTKIGKTTTGRLNGTMKTSIRVCLQGNKKWRKWESLAGYTVEQLKNHLEKKFKNGMTWDNYGTLWEIDHIIPKAAFNYETAEDIDFKKCWALGNLQPLECSINRRKKDYLDKPHQPSLNIAA